MTALTFNSLIEYYAVMPVSAAPHVDTIFSALGDPVRLAIVEHLTVHAFATVNDLAAQFPISLQAVSKHIKVLETAGLVSRGRWLPTSRGKLIGRNIKYPSPMREL